MEENDDKNVSTSKLHETAQGNSGTCDTDELVAFRSQWKEELALEEKTSKTEGGLSSEEVKTEGDRSLALSTKSDGSHGLSPVKKTDESKDTKQEATSLFKMGVAAEKSGDMSGAVKYYRQALQLDPDVESRYDQMVYSDYAARVDEDVDEYSSITDGDLASRLARDMESLSIKEWCTPKRLPQGGHISDLPVEVLRYILRWVVSSLLDMRAVEHVAMVCRGFYILAREPYLWRAACRRLWSGESCQVGSYGNWRRMYILRPHLHFNGVYISKMSYVREGEHSLDGFYRPYHTVTYYRYLHFFSDGDVMYRTTPDEPAVAVTSLCHKHSSESILLGRYSVSDKTVLIDLVSDNSHSQVQQLHHKGRGRHKQAAPTQEYRFHMELQMKNRSKQMTWIKHSCTTIHIPTGEQQLDEFSINYMYTPFYFSRVKSYSHSSNSLL